nr:polymer-forming cytoskeletal protein [Vibrio cyclitrophicus]
MSLGSVGGDASAAGNLSINNATVQGSIRSGNGHLISVSNNGSVQGNVDAGATITIQDSNVVGDVSNRGGNPITIQSYSSIGGNVDAGTTIIIQDSNVIGDVSNRGGNPITIQSYSSIGGNVDAGTAIIIQDSDVVGDVSNRGDNPVTIQSDSSIDGNIDSQGVLIIEGSEVQGNISSANSNIELDDGSEIHGNATAANNNWATIYFKDYDDSDRSIVHGTCLYRTEPEDACGAIEPPINQNPQFEFGTLTKDSCRIIESGTNDDADRQRVSCTLEFDKTYTTVPLVFVMPTIDASLSVLSARTTELPSTASVIGTSLTSATVVQEIAPSAKRNTSNTTYLDAPMLSDEDLNSLNIDYFVIQEGVISLGSGKGRIVAGLVETNTAASQISNERSNADIVNFENYGLSSFSNTPGVLVQPQTKNNSSAWFTGMARGVNTERFYLALEKSEVINNNDISEPEKVAFVAGEGSGITQGARFFLGSGETRVTTTLNEKVISPIEIGCEESTSISEANFDAPPILIANKNSRSGNNGGWVRRCHVTEDEVYFIVEEDMDKDSERSHIAEDVGFFMFDRPNELGICDGFNNKSPVQTWIRTDGTIGAFEAYNSSRVIGSFKDGNRRYLGFDDDWMTDGTNWSTGGACDGLECGGLEDLMVPKELLEDMPDNLTVSVNVNAGDTLTLPLTDSDGQPIYEYQTLNVGGIVTIEAGKYKIGSINVWEDGEVQVKSGDSVTIFTNKLQLNNRAFFGVPIDSRGVDKPTLEADTYLRVNVLESNSNSVNINSNSSTKPSTFVGLLYSEQPVRISNDARIYGGVAAESVHMSGQSLISAATSCMLPSDDYEIEISPATDLALMCGDDSPQFTINTSNNGVGESLGVTVGITPDADEFDVSLLKGSGAYPNYVSNNDGELTIQVTAKSTSSIDFDTSYKLTAILVEDSDKEVESQFKFVPFKFSLVDGDSPTNRLDVIAGQATPTVTKVLACDLGDSIVVAENYVGEAEKQVTITHELDNSWNGSDGTLTYLPEFKKGSAATDLTISESGLFNVTLKDSSFDCTGFAGCPDDGSYDLEGNFSIYSRPWQFAICTDNNSDGNSSSGAAFVAAGEAFDVYARPIKYTNSSSVCSDDNLLTNNYFKSTASVEVTTTLDTPLITAYPDANLGDLTPETQLIKQISSNDQSNKGYKFESLKYSEVGSFNFVATETGSFYGSILGGFSGSKSIGRFYPKYFIQGSPEWNVANQNDIAYLSQPYDSTVHQVYPMASGENDTDNALNNYRFFSSDLQASFGILDDASIDNGFLLDTEAGTWSTTRYHWLLNDNAAELQRVTDSDDVSRRDAPFNTSDANSTATNFGLTIEGTDPVSFTDSDTLTNSAAFPVQPPARYGRMALDDIGGNSDTTLTIPLRAEFWDGSEFVVNDDDNRSTFNGSNTCKQVIWHSEGVTTTLASLSGSRSVDDGEEEVTANQNTPSGTDAPREQVRLWLRMDDSAPTAKTGENPITCLGSDQEQPWLRYNWRQLGDEDPSTVVTFGIYRGNDRVIYRGESGLTGQ